MGELDRIKQGIWCWMAAYAILSGIVEGATFGTGGFNGGAMIIAILVSFGLLAPVQLFFSALKEMVNQQEKQTSTLAELVKALAPGALEPTHATNAKPAAQAEGHVAKVAALTAPERRARLANSRPLVALLAEPGVAESARQTRRIYGKTVAAEFLTEKAAELGYGDLEIDPDELADLL